MRYATGKDSKAGHSTGTHYDDVDKKKKKYAPVKHSIGSEMPIKHSSGIEFEKRAAEEEEE